MSDQASSDKDYIGDYNSVDFKEKIEVIVSMKMHQMVKKVELIAKALKDNNPFEGIKEDVVFGVFKRVITRMFNYNSDRVKLSDDDLKTIFFLLDSEKKSQLTIDQINVMKNPTSFFNDLKEFYKYRINPELIKNTELKKGRFGGSSAIQVFQLKNPSVTQRSSRHWNSDKSSPYSLKTMRSKGPSPTLSPDSAL